MKAFHFEMDMGTNYKVHQIAQVVSDAHNTVNIVDNKMDTINSMINLLFLNKGFDPNPKDVSLTKFRHASPRRWQGDPRSGGPGSKKILEWRSGCFYKNLANTRRTKTPKIMRMRKRKITKRPYTFYILARVILSSDCKHSFLTRCYWRLILGLVDSIFLVRGLWL